MGHMDNSREEPEQPCPASQVPACLVGLSKTASPTVMLLEGVGEHQYTPITISSLFNVVV